MTERNNYSAFPVAAGNNVIARGMTLRDYFAGQALAGMMSYQNEVSGDFHNNCQNVGEYAYRIADAMLEARK